MADRRERRPSGKTTPSHTNKDRHVCCRGDASCFLIKPSAGAKGNRGHESDQVKCLIVSKGHSVQISFNYCVLIIHGTFTASQLIHCLFCSADSEALKQTMVYNHN